MTSDRYIFWLSRYIILHVKREEVSNNEFYSFIIIFPVDSNVLQFQDGVAIEKYFKLLDAMETYLP